MKWLTASVVRKVAYPVAMAIAGALVDGGVLDQELYHTVVGVLQVAARLFGLS